MVWIDELISKAKSGKTLETFNEENLHKFLINSETLNHPRGFWQSTENINELKDGMKKWKDKDIPCIV